MSEAQAQFRRLSARLLERAGPGEVLLLNFCGEDSDFVRLNGGRLRSVGHVHQGSLRIDLIHGQRSASAVLQLSGREEHDLGGADGALQRLREQLPHLPEDPFLHYATRPQDTLHRCEDRLPATAAAVEDLIEAAGGRDLTGFLANGEMSFGFANSLGQFNWHSDYSFHADWSLHDGEQAAVKQSYAGFTWEPEFVTAKLAYAVDTLALLRRPAKALAPGRYRVFLEPPAVNELLRVVGYEGFGTKSQRTAQTPLLRMDREGLRLSPQVSLREDHAGGRTPRFTEEGFVNPEAVELIESGRRAETLTGARSAREYGLPVNAAVEHPESLYMAGGTLHQDRILQTLGTGIHIGNLWYCNLSDRRGCRITGLTRFSCLWVEDGVPVAPVAVMRFDESLYHLLGDGLVALTEEHERLFDASTYERRSEASATLPGALVEDFTLTL